MIKLEKKHRVDWFRVTVDLNSSGISTNALSKMTGIPRSTLDCWRNKVNRPRIEEAIIVLNAWADITGKDIDDVPVYNPYLPDGHHDQP